MNLSQSIPASPKARGHPRGSGRVVTQASTKFGRKVNSVQQLREEMLDVIGQLEGRLSGKLDELLDEKNVRAAADDNSRYVSAASMRSAGSAAPSVSSPGAWPAQFEEAVAARPEASDRVYKL